MFSLNPSRCKIFSAKNGWFLIKANRKGRIKWIWAHLIPGPRKMGFTCLVFGNFHNLLPWNKKHWNHCWVWPFSPQILTGFLWGRISTLWDQHPRKHWRTIKEQEIPLKILFPGICTSFKREKWRVNLCEVSNPWFPEWKLPVPYAKNLLLPDEIIPGSCRDCRISIPKDWHLSFKVLGHFEAGIKAGIWRRGATLNYSQQLLPGWELSVPPWNSLPSPWCG